MSTPLQRALASGPNALIDEFAAAHLAWNSFPGENDIRERYRVAHAALYEALVRPPGGCGIARAWLAEWSDRDDASRMEVLFDEPVGDHGYERVTALGVIQPDEPTEAMLVAGLRECEPLGDLIDWREGFGRDEMRKVWAAMQAAR